MTPRNRKQICHRAMELVATKDERWSCCAIEEVSDYCGGTGYALFYNKREHLLWHKGLPDIYEESSPTEEQINWRLMLLAWYAEVGLEGIGL